MSWSSIQVDNRRFSFTECWYLAPGWFSRTIVLFAKIFRIRLKMGPPIPMAARARDYEIQEENIPPHILGEIAPLLQELTALGFNSPQFSMATTRKVQNVEVCSVALPHRSGEMLAHVCYTKLTTLHPPLLRVFAGLQTRIGDDRSLSTTSGPRQMDPVRGDLVWYHIGMPVRELFEAHLRHLGEAQNVVVERIGSVSAVWEVLERNHQRMLAERLARGVWHEVAPEPGESEQPTIAGPPPLPENPDEPVLAEIAKLQQGKKGWGSAILIFGATLLLFLFAGSWQWSWRFVGVLVPILLFHELGHYIAMRLFGYQNLRIFFVPFFGAAVTGLRLNAPGWQQAIVALAGPIPGILAGWAMLYAARNGDYGWLERFGLLCVILNGFNLLPILPLDGGRVLDALIFVRNRWFEAGAVALAAAGLLILNHFGLGRIFLFLGLMMLFSLPHVWRNGRLTAQIRTGGFIPEDPSARSISREAAVAIIGGIRAHHSPKFPLVPKTLAQMVVSIYGRLHTKAPGWLAVVALLGTYGGALGLAGFLGFQTFTLRWQTQRLMRQLSEPVKTTLSCRCEDGLDTSRSGAPRLPNQLRIAATFPSGKDSTKAFVALSQQFSSSAVISRVGPAILVSAPVEGPEVDLVSALSTLQSLGGNPMIPAGSTNQSLAVHLRAVFSDEATAGRLEASLNDYFLAPAEYNLPPPWVQEEEFDATQRATLRRRLQLHRSLESTWTIAREDPQFNAVEEKLLEAIKKRDQDAARKLAKEQAAMQLEHAKALQRQILATNSEATDRPMIEAYLRRPENGARGTDWDEWQAEMGLALRGQQPEALAVLSRAASAQGWAERKARELTLPFIRFADPSNGLLGVIHYFCDHGCGTVQFELVVTDGD